MHMLARLMRTEKTSFGIAFLLLFFIAGAHVAHAQIPPAQSLERRIAELLLQVQELQRRIAEIEKNNAVDPDLISPPSQTPDAPPVILLFTETLARGANGASVTLLQEKLKTDPSIYPEGFVTGFFGPLTEAAIKRFQVRHQLSLSGELDEETRKKANSVFSAPSLKLPAVDDTGMFFITPEKESGAAIGAKFAIRWKPPADATFVSFTLLRNGIARGPVFFRTTTGSESIFVSNSGAAVWELPDVGATTPYGSSGGAGFALLAQTSSGARFLSQQFSILPKSAESSQAARPLVLRAPASPQSFRASEFRVPQGASINYYWESADTIIDHYELLSSAHGIVRWVNIGKTTRARIRASGGEGNHESKLRSCAEYIVPCPDTSASSAVSVRLQITTPAPTDPVLTFTPQQFARVAPVTIAWGAENAATYDVEYDFDPQNGFADRIDRLTQGMNTAMYPGTNPSIWPIGKHRARLVACDTRGMCARSEWASFEVASADSFIDLAPSFTALTQTPSRIVRGAAVTLRWTTARATHVWYQRDWFRDDAVDQEFVLSPAADGTLQFTDTADLSRWPFGEHRFRLKACGPNGCSFSRWYNYEVTEIF